MKGRTRHGGRRAGSGTATSKDQSINAARNIHGRPRAKRWVRKALAWFRWFTIMRLYQAAIVRRRRELAAALPGGKGAP